MSNRLSKLLRFSRGSLTVVVLTSIFATASGSAEEKANETDPVTYEVLEDLPYRSAEQGELTEYMEERCRLDLYYPTNRKGFATVVWFHGGGLKAGSKSIPKALKSKGVAVVPVNYRLHPNVEAPAYIEDAAAAVAWTFQNIAEYGGSTERIYVSGHSAGGYLTSMIGLDKQWLKAFDIDADQIAGLIPFSGHTVTHFTVRKERGIGEFQPQVDEMAPLYHVRKDAPPLLLITGDRDLELWGRYEENAYLWRMMEVVKHPNTEILELEGYDHGGMAEPAFPLLLKFIESVEKQNAESADQ